MQIVKLQTYFSPKIWGGTKLQEFGFQLPDQEKIGEAWVISAHDNGLSYLKSGKFVNQSLKKVFDEHRELFNNYQGEFPLLVKIITANDYLSVQVHPDDQYAKTKHNSLGKPESWYVLDAPKDAYLIYGHNAKTKEELELMVNENKWDDLLVKVPVTAGDFLYVEPGKVHAITPGVSVCEIQRSSDITYRFYDYNRFDDKGNSRRLDIEDSINCTKIPDSLPHIVRNATNKIFSNEYFDIYLWNVGANQQLHLENKPYWYQMTVLDGEGTINGQKFVKGDSAISLGEIEDLKGTGNLKILLSWISQ